MHACTLELRVEERLFGRSALPVGNADLAQGRARWAGRRVLGEERAHVMV